MLAAKKKRKHSTWMKQYIRDILIIFQNWKPMIWVIRNENPASTGSLAGSKQVFLHSTSTKTNKPAANLLHIETDAAVHDQFFDPKVESWSKTCTNLSKTWLGLQLARKMEYGPNQAHEAQNEYNYNILIVHYFCIPTLASITVTALQHRPYCWLLKISFSFGLGLYCS